MTKNIELGDKVRCKYSGFEGIAVAKTEFINGCVQYSVMPRMPKSKAAFPPEEVSMDEQSLDIITKKKETIEKDETGGPNKRNIRMKGW